jgi:uncharacterized repeat protein (TIGR03803 family)
MLRLPAHNVSHALLFPPLNACCLFFATAATSLRHAKSAITSAIRRLGPAASSGIRREIVMEANMSQYRYTIIACTLALCCAFTVNPASAQVFAKMASFGGTSGADPQSSVVQGADANYYGTTYFGGTMSGCEVGYPCGNIFRMTPGGLLTNLYSFCSLPKCADGAWPVEGLTVGSNGHLYGTTSAGGLYNGGTIFEVTLAGKLTTLYNFCALTFCAEGTVPRSVLLLASNGSFYGTTSRGGAGGGGTVFEITPTGHFSTVYQFCSLKNCADGSGPMAGLIQGTDGNLYGTTAFGGNSGSLNDFGTIFKLTPTGSLSTLYDFCSQSGCTDGGDPQDPLVQALNGNLYGTTLVGGTSAECAQPGCGVAFEITTTGTYTKLHDFCSEPSCADGGQPYAGMIQATDGNLYGTTHLSREESVIYQITPSGTFRTVHTFCGNQSCPYGDAPYAGLFQSTNGVLYGTTIAGGTSNTCTNCGIVYAYDLDLPVFVQAVPATGKVGQAILVLGKQFSNASSVTFNGTPASFTVLSDTYLKAQVPAGATSGTIVVTSPYGTFTQNVPFQVLP